MQYIHVQFIFRLFSLSKNDNDFGDDNNDADASKLFWQLYFMYLQLQEN